MNISAKQFDAANARECAVWSAQAYGNTSGLPGAYFIANPATSTEVLVIMREECIVLAFRGSREVADWITDAKFFRDLLVEEADGERCEVHSGFLRAYESVIEKLSVDLARLTPDKSLPIFVTGHSLGGALAILAALELKRQKFNVTQVYTFGQPRVGNAAFADLYNWSLQDSTFCVVNEGDPVPLLPTLLMGYRDCGQEIFIRKSGVVEVDPFIGLEIFRDVLGAIGAWRKGTLGLLPNHFITRYQDQIHQIA